MALPVYYYFQLCETPIDTSRGFPPRGKDEKGLQKRWEPPFILMTESGGCSMTTKARHAQFAGASALVVVEHACECGDSYCIQNITWRSDVPCEEKIPHPSDDGSGGDVTIPSFLLPKTEGASIEQAITNHGESILMSIRWHERKTRDKIYFGIWVDPLDQHSKGLLAELMPIVLALGHRAEFYVNYFVHDGSRTNCRGDDGGKAEEDQLCYNVCTNNGRYCYPSLHFSGSSVVTEILRRLCIWKKYSDEAHGSVSKHWWDYMMYFEEHCSGSDGTYASDKCVHSAMTHAGIKMSEVSSCMVDSGDPAGDTTNQLLEHEVVAQKEYGVVSAPTVWAHGRVLRPTDWLDVRVIFELVCRGYEGGFEPEVCTRCRGAHDIVLCSASDYHSKVEKTAERRLLLWSCLLTSFVAFGYAYKKYKDTGGVHLGGVASSLQYAILQDGEQGGDEI